MLDGSKELDDDEQWIPADLEVASVPSLEGGIYPGLYLFSMGGRVIREVHHQQSGLTEHIGSLEQQHLDIWCPDGKRKKKKNPVAYTHEELHTKNMLSIIAALTPFSQFNQSPRNTYQCKMAEQTMGTPCHDLQFRPDNKLYRFGFSRSSGRMLLSRLHAPQRPICRTQQYEAYHLDEYPSGTNAVVAVISHTGYDMEDAMILNKASVDRGFAHGCVYTTQQLFLKEGAMSSLLALD